MADIRPTTLPEWASDVSALIAEPSDGQKDSGWTTTNGTATGTAQKPSLQTFNWWMNNTYEYIKFVDSALPTSGVNTSSEFLLNNVFNATVALNIAHLSTPSSPSVGNSSLYPKSDNRFYQLDSSGNEERLALTDADTISNANLTNATLPNPHIRLTDNIVAPVEIADPYVSAVDATDLATWSRTVTNRTDVTSTLTLDTNSVLNGTNSYRFQYDNTANSDSVTAGATSPDISVGTTGLYKLSVRGVAGANSVGSWGMSFALVKDGNYNNLLTDLPSSTSASLDSGDTTAIDIELDFLIEEIGTYNIIVSGFVGGSGSFGGADFVDFYMDDMQLESSVGTANIDFTNPLNKITITESLSFSFSNLIVGDSTRVIIENSTASQQYIFNTVTQPIFGDSFPTTIGADTSIELELSYDGTNIIIGKPYNIESPHRSTITTLPSVYTSATDATDLATWTTAIPGFTRTAPTFILDTTSKLSTGTNSYRWTGSNSTRSIHTQNITVDTPGPYSLTFNAIVGASSSGTWVLDTSLFNTASGGFVSGVAGNTNFSSTSSGEISGTVDIDIVDPGSYFVELRTSLSNGETADFYISNIELAGNGMVALIDFDKPINIVDSETTEHTLLSMNRSAGKSTKLIIEGRGDIGTSFASNTRAELVRNFLSGENVGEILDGYYHFTESFDIYCTGDLNIISSSVSQTPPVEYFTDSSPSTLDFTMRTNPRTRSAYAGTSSSSSTFRFPALARGQVISFIVNAGFVSVTLQIFAQGDTDPVQINAADTLVIPASDGYLITLQNVFPGVSYASAIKIND